MRVYFHHIGKTGGTTLRNLLLAVFGERNVAPMIRSGKYREALATHADLPVITGHLHVLPGDTLPADRASITLLREPVDRTLSSFFFLANTHLAGRRDAHTAGGDFSTWLAELDEHDGMDALNLQVTSLWGFGWTEPSMPDWNARVAAAKRALDGFDVTGICSLMAESIAVTFHRLGRPAPEVIPHDNPTAGRAASTDLPASTLQRLERLIAPDRELYEYALKLFGRQRLRVLREAARLNAAGGPPESATAASPPIAREPDGETNAPGVAITAPANELVVVRVLVRGELSEREFLHVGEHASISVHFVAHAAVDDLTVGIELRDDAGALVFGTSTRLLGETVSVTRGRYKAVFRFPNELGLGRYWITAALHLGESHLQKCFHWLDRATSFEVIDQLNDFAGRVRLHMEGRVEADDAEGRVTAVAVKAKSAQGFTLLGRRNPALTEFAAALVAKACVPSMQPASEALIDMNIANIGTESWPAFGKHAVAISYHWLDAGGHVVVYDGLRTSLPSDVEPGRQIGIRCMLRAPDAPGERVLLWTLVQEGVAWFADRRPESQVTWTVRIE